MNRLLLTTVLWFASGLAMAQSGQTRYVRIAELEIEPAHIEAFAVAAREVGQASVRLEEGCIGLYAVAERDNPGRVRVFEVYRDPGAYDVHLQTPHFKKFRATTQAMIKSRKLIDAAPISLATKPGMSP
jgi:quinol monooxygenase YgiN